MAIEKKGLMFVLSSPSGAGKTTLTKKLAEHNSQFIISISHTTRKPRPSEVNGKDLGLKLYGSRALMSLRLEKNWGAWTLDFRPDFTAIESGLDAFINWNKDFIGKEPTLNEKKQGPKKKLVTMTIDTDDIDVTNDEAILKDKKCVGYITSGGYAHHVKKSMALGYVPPELSKHNSTLDVEINGKLYLAHVTDKPLYDANGEKMKS